MNGERIRTLDGLRALAITEVVLYHLGLSVCSGMVSRFVITFFFILSGYLMTMRYGDIKPNMTGVKRIITRRILHFLPLYWLTLVVLVIFTAWSIRWDLPLHILLLQSWIPNSYYCFSYNEVAWFISTLLVCYICFPIINGILRRLTWRVQIALFVTVCWVYYIMLYVLQPNDDYIYYICPATRLIDFVAGMTLYRVLHSLLANGRKLPVSLATVLEFVTVLVIVGCNVVVYSVPNNLRMLQYTLLWYVPALMLITVMGHHCLASGILARILSWQVFVKVGRLSMEIFILHYLTVGLVRKALEATQISVPAWLFIIVALLVTLIAAILAHRFITVPVKNWLSQYFEIAKDSQSS